MAELFLRAFGTVTGGLLVSLLVGCAAAQPSAPGPGAPGGAAAPSSPRVPVAVPTPVAVPELFLGKMEGRGNCPEGQAQFLVPWVNSPQYDPKVTFVRAPDPVAVCIAFARTAPDTFKGLNIKLQKDGSTYSVVDPAFTLPRR